MTTGPGTVLGGRYRLEERIAGGGMGDVWRAGDEVLGRTVAVKILLPALLDEQGFADRFRGEARTMATISHPGVVNVYDYGSDPTVAYLVMEYVHGDPLSRILVQVGRLTAGRTMALVAQAASALQAAHDRGIVHRDVKPGNLLVRPNGTLVLVDFGIARSPIVGQLTAAGSVLGTASYISPEQASGAVATPLSDIYALGVVAYQCLSGRRPFEGGNPVEIAMKHVREQAPRLPEDVPPAVRGIVERAMDKDPSRRFPTATAFATVARQASRALAGGRAGHAPTASGVAPSARPGSTRVMAPDQRAGAGQAPPAGPGQPARPVPQGGPGHHPGTAAPARPPAAGQQQGRPAAGPARHGRAGVPGQPHAAGAGPTRPAPGGHPHPAPVAGAGPHPPGYPRGSAGIPPARPGPPPQHGAGTPGILARGTAGAFPSPRRHSTLAVWLLVALAVLLLCAGGPYLARLLAAAARPGGTPPRPAVAAPGGEHDARACQARPGILITMPVADRLDCSGARGTG